MRDKNCFQKKKKNLKLHFDGIFLFFAVSVSKRPNVLPCVKTI